ncbi:hypothetical protein ACJX0J_027155, partial [Zea mays]
GSFWSTTLSSGNLLWFTAIGWLKPPGAGASHYPKPEADTQLKNHTKRVWTLVSATLYGTVYRRWYDGHLLFRLVTNYKARLLKKIVVTALLMQHNLLIALQDIILFANLNLDIKKYGMKNKLQDLYDRTGYRPVTPDLLSVSQAMGIMIHIDLLQASNLAHNIDVVWDEDIYWHVQVAWDRKNLVQRNPFFNYKASKFFLLYHELYNILDQWDPGISGIFSHRDTIQGHAVAWGQATFCEGGNVTSMNSNIEAAEFWDLKLIKGIYRLHYSVLGCIITLLYIRQAIMEKKGNQTAESKADAASNFGEQSYRCICQPLLLSFLVGIAQISQPNNCEYSLFIFFIMTNIFVFNNSRLENLDLNYILSIMADVGNLNFNLDVIFVDVCELL